MGYSGSDKDLQTNPKNEKEIKVKRIRHIPLNNVI